MEWLWPHEIAETYGVARTTVDAWYKAGLPFEWRDGPHGRGRRSRGEDVEEWLTRTKRLAALKRRLKSKAEPAAITTSTKEPSLPKGGLFDATTANDPPSIENLQAFFKRVLAQCESIEKSGLDVLSLNYLTSSMKRLGSEVRALDERRDVVRRESGEWIEKARALNLNVGLAALFVTDLDAMIADAVNDGAVQLDPFVIAGKLDDVRRVLAVVLRGGVDKLRGRIAEAAAGLKA